MYRILVISDTHGRYEYAERAICNISKIDHIIHLGDYLKDAHYLESVYSEYLHTYVSGNNDLFSSSSSQRVIELSGVKFLITHGHSFDVRSGLSRLEKYAKEQGVKVVLFGHTHTPYCEKVEGILFLNPGGFNAMPKPSCGIIEIENGVAKGCLYVC